ncbi:hypothetical protein PES01_33090 [Pseudoalteromonas espejiana]|uniref:Uncharacterized protein n=1 Tax=Pseudoalteromonas espejiana TaxID=28107 RepID=A0A510XZG7_9GAMM|nr:hypothetical protein PES01_33090 [Pseudoalteromonas espejiana]
MTFTYDGIYFPISDTAFLINYLWAPFNANSTFYLPSVSFAVTALAIFIIVSAQI